MQVNLFRNIYHKFIGFKNRNRHNIDLDNPIIDNLDIIYNHNYIIPDKYKGFFEDENDRQEKKRTQFKGFICEKCGRIFWLRHMDDVKFCQRVYKDCGKD